ncbi:hypothetical protein [Hyphomonas sp.]
MEKYENAEEASVCTLNLGMQVAVMTAGDAGDTRGLPRESAA